LREGEKQMENIVEFRPTGLPCGFYSAEFIGTEMAEHEEYGPGIRWKFRVIDNGEFQGFDVSKTTAAYATAGNGTGRLLAAISGVGKIDPSLGKVDMRTYIGQVYRLNVLESPNGGTRIDSVQPTNF